jgi:hypothetical protein
MSPSKRHRRNFSELSGRFSELRQRGAGLGFPWIAPVVGALLAYPALASEPEATETRAAGAGRR